MWFEKLRAVVQALTKPSRWKRAVKCKKLIKQLQNHVSIQRNRKESMVRQSRADVAQLLQNGQLQKALYRVVQLYKDQQLLCAYDKIEHFCVHIMTNISHVNKQSSWQLLPIDVGEALSSLIFAASRCGELPALHLIRSLFKERFGSEFEGVNVQLRPGNLVNSQMKQYLCIKSVPDDEKLNLINEIAKEYNLRLVFQDSKAQDYSLSEQKAEVLDLEIKEVGSDTDECSTQVAKLPTLGKVMSPWLMNKQENHSTRTSVDSTSQIYETSIVYLDDLEEKKIGREVHHGLNPSGRSRSSENNAKRNCRNSMVPGTPHCHSITQDQRRRNNCGMLVKDHISWDGSMDKMNAQKGNHACSPSYVHPKLPEYDTVVAKQKNLEAEYRQHKNISLLLNR
ncbi:hypothetical protein SLEP1_g26638 [Rubroshorea leprosula]|uniref:IST1-like protein n=1 Tax=Rubroshorea leprosula TaxID=152421 RepID=A0AAV5JWB9_9ROSI|nr:hypothetical protein SLEP1_g26638 [Rubroshorea leprosula]